jgi:hypothetical protein
MRDGFLTRRLFDLQPPRPDKCPIRTPDVPRASPRGDGVHSQPHTRNLHHGAVMIVRDAASARKGPVPMYSRALCATHNFCDTFERRQHRQI